MNSKIDIQKIKDVLWYNEDTGVLFWKVNRCSVKAGDVAGCIRTTKRTGKKYVWVVVNRSTHPIHRIIWSMFFGEIPNGMQIDHIDGDGLNNRISNLRLVNREMNSQNQHKAHRNNLCGLLGVSFRGEWNLKKPWQARIYVDGRKRSIGHYETKEQAHAAYLEAKRELHPGCVI